MVDLTKTSIEFEDIVQELEADLQTKDSFKALFPGETSTIFTEHGAGITALMLYHIHSAAQNAFMPTAFSKQAVYALAISLGTPPRRKVGSEVTLAVTVGTLLAASVTLPKFSRFSARGLEWYTTEDVIIPAGPIGQVLNLSVRQGERVTETLTSTGNDNQRIEVGENFTIDEQFLTVEVDNVLYTSNGPSLLGATLGDLAYAEQTTANGRVLILFGNNIIGSIPTIGQTISISYAMTSGLSSNSSIVGDTFSYLEVLDIGGGTFLDLTGVSTSTASGGGDEESVAQVKNSSPKRSAANKRAVRRDDYLGHVLNFTGALGGRIWGEYEEALQKSFASLEMMNRAFVSVLPPVVNDLTDEVLATGDGVIADFIGTISTDLMPGTLVVKSDTSTWYDYDGRGLLLSSNNGTDESNGGTPRASENNGTSGSAWASPTTTQWESLTQPSALNPIRVSYEFATAIQVRSFRIRAGNDANNATRGFPKEVVLLGSNEVSPDLTTRDDWVVLRGSSLTLEPGFGGSSRFYPVDNPASTTTYKHVALEIIGVHNNAPTTQISDIIIQDESNSSTVNYTTGEIELKYVSGVEPTGDITVDSYNGNYTEIQKQEIVDFLEDLNHFTTLVDYRNPVAVLVDVVADVYFLEGFESTTVLSDVQNALTALFEVKQDTLSKTIHLSDVYEAIVDVQGVDYTLISNPTTNITTEIDQYVLLNSQTISVFPTDR